MHYRDRFRLIIVIVVIVFVLFIKFTCYGQNGFVRWKDGCNLCKCSGPFAYSCEDNICGPINNGFCGTSTYGNCQAESDCITDGCSGQICKSVYEDSYVTTCEMRDCYNNELYNLECSCVENKCQWS